MRDDLLYPTSRWGVVGLGRAGQARLRAIDARPHLELAGTVGRRPGRGTTTLDALLADETVDGVVICSENAHHAPAAARALAAGKHVIVEFPLAPNATEGRALFELARRHDRVLHTEFIGLLTARHAAVRDTLASTRLGALRSRFTGGSYRWVADEIRAGRIGSLVVGRLHALHALAGPLAIDDVTFERTADGYHLRVDMTGRQGVRIELDERRAPGLKRSSRLAASDADGALLAIPDRPEPGDLFGRDFDVALARIRGDAHAAYVSDDAILFVLGLADRIDGAIRRS